MRPSKLKKNLNQFVEVLLGLSVMLLPLAYISDIIYPNQYSELATEITASIICLIVIYVVIVKQIGIWKQ